MNDSSTIQSNAKAGGDIVAGSKVTTTNNVVQNQTLVDKLMRQLAHERECDNKIQTLVDSLQYFEKRISTDGIQGLEKKLDKAGRSDETHRALELKELFNKLLDRWSLYASAQELFAHLLYMAEGNFNTYILPYVEELDRRKIDELILEKVVIPIIDQAVAGVFSINAGHAHGIVYWLGERCFVRWHK